MKRAGMNKLKQGASPIPSSFAPEAFIIFPDFACSLAGANIIENPIWLKHWDGNQRALLQSGERLLSIATPSLQTFN